MPFNHLKIKRTVRDFSTTPPTVTQLVGDWGIGDEDVRLISINNGDEICGGNGTDEDEVIGRLARKRFPKDNNDRPVLVLQDFKSNNATACQNEIARLQSQFNFQQI